MKLGTTRLSYFNSKVNLCDRIVHKSNMGFACGCDMYAFNLIKLFGKIMLVHKSVEI